MSHCSLIGIVEGPFLGSVNGSLLIGFPEISNFLIKWIIQVWKGHQSLDGEKNGSNLKCWGPLVLENIQADSAKLVDIWVVDLGSEQDLWWDHWVFVWQEKFTVKDSSLIWSFTWTSDLDKEMSSVFLVGFSIDSHN